MHLEQHIQTGSAQTAEKTGRLRAFECQLKGKGSLNQAARCAPKLQALQKNEARWDESIGRHLADVKIPYT